MVYPCVVRNRNLVFIYQQDNCEVSKMGGVTLCVSAICGACLSLFNIPNFWNINFVLTAAVFYGVGQMNFSRINAYLTDASVKRLLLSAVVCSLISFIFIFNNPQPEFFINNLARVWITIPAAFSGACMMFCVAALLSRWQHRVSRPVKFALKYFGRNSYIVLAFHQIVIMLLPVVGLRLNGHFARLTMWAVIILLIEFITRYTPWVLGREKTKK